MCVRVCVWGGGGARAGGVGEREVCAGVLRAIVSGCLPAGGGGVPVASACGAWAQREKRRGGASQPGQGQRSACVYGGGWGVGGGGWGGECVVRGVCGRGANGLGVCAPVCVRCVGCACGCGGGGLAQRHS